MLRSALTASGSAATCAVVGLASAIGFSRNNDVRCDENPFARSKSFKRASMDDGTDDFNNANSLRRGGSFANAQALTLPMKGTVEETKLLKAYRQKYGHRMVTLCMQDVKDLLREIHLTDHKLAKHVFQLMDKEGTGEVQYTQFVNFLQVAAQGTQEERIKFIFDACDLDGNGKIDRDGIRATVKQMWLAKHAFSGYCDNVLFANEVEAQHFEGLSADVIAQIKSNKLCSEMFRIADQQKNNEISYKEFAFWVKRGGRDVDTFKLLFEGFNMFDRDGGKALHI